MTAVAVLDIGKTNIKLSAASRDGAILETIQTANTPLAGPPYLHPDLDGIEGWFLDNLAGLGRRHHIGAVVACGHGSATALVDDAGAVMPMIDYEEAPPGAVDAKYHELAGTLAERGSGILPGAAHPARQLLWLAMEWPEAIARARWFLGSPQYWAWRLSGVAATELTYLGAQSHLWNVREKRFTPIVERFDWARLLPPLQPAWAPLGRLKPDVARRHGIPGAIEVLCGIHDSSANFYRYQQAGLVDLAVISTGTWIVGLGDIRRPEEFAVADERGCNADVHGRPLAGVLAMGGREFALLAGASSDRPVSPDEVAALVARGTMALPSFADHDGVFPKSGGRGRIAGPEPATPEARRALALLYVALQTDACLDAMGDNATTVLDGSFVRDPLYASLVAALRPDRRILFSTDAYGTAAGAALLADHERRKEPAAVDTRTPKALSIRGLADYASRWRSLAVKHHDNARTEASR